MRNSVAKRLRKQAGVQTSTSNQMEYEYLKKEHMRTEVNPKFKRSARQERMGRAWKTASTIIQWPKKAKKIARLKA